MVSIFGGPIYQETASIDVNDGDAPTAFNFPSVSADSLLGGFTYAETLDVTIEYTSTFTLKNDSGGDSNGDIKNFTNPEFIFNNQFNLFNNISQKTLIDTFIPAGQTQTFTDLSGSVSYNLDTYIDIPAIVDPQHTVDNGAYLESVGNQTITAEMTINVIGRQP